MAEQTRTFDVASETTSQQIKTIVQNIQNNGVSGGGGSVSAIVVTPTADMVGETMTLSLEDGETLTKEIESTSKVIFKASYIGVYTLSCGTHETSVTVTNLGEIVYATWGCIINVTFTASEAIGLTLTATKGSNSVTATVGSDKKATFNLDSAGTWDVMGRKVTLSQLGNTVNITEDIYGYNWTMTESNPDNAITYPSTVTNANFDNIGTRGSDAEIDLGDWETFRDDFLECRPVMLNFDGTVAYELNHDNQNYKLDGSTASDISDSSKSMNAMVEFPKRYIKRWTSGSVAYFRISRMKLDSSYKAYPWMYGTNEASAFENDAIYLPMFEGSSVSSKVRSIAGQTPMNTNAGATEYTQITALGTGWQFDDWADKSMITDFMFMMGKSTNVQTHHGNGHYSGGSGASSLLTTGGTKAYGSNYGGNGNSYMKFLWLENYYGDRWDRTFGVWYISSVLYVKMFPPYTTDGTVANYTNLNRAISGTSGGYISEVTYDENGMIPKTVSGSDSTYVPDGCWFSNGTRFLLWGAHCSAGLRVGAAFDVDLDFSYSNWNIGPSPAYKNTQQAA